MFQTVIAADRAKHREMGAYGPQSFVTIHRDTLMQVRNSLHAFSDARRLSAIPRAHLLCLDAVAFVLLESIRFLQARGHPND